MAFIEYEWGSSQDRKVLKLSRKEVLANALRLLRDGPEAAPGDSEMKRAAWRAATKRGVHKLCIQEHVW